MFETLNNKFDRLNPAWQIFVIVCMYTFTFFVFNLTGQLIDFIEKRTILQHLASAFGAGILLTVLFDRKRIKAALKRLNKHSKRV